MHGTGRQGQARAALAVGGVFPQELLQWELGTKVKSRGHKGTTEAPSTLALPSQS